MTSRALDSEDERVEGWLNEAEAGRGVNVGAVTRRDEVEIETERARTVECVGVECTDERRDGVAGSERAVAGTVDAGAAASDRTDENETRGLWSCAVELLGEKLTDVNESAEQVPSVQCWCLAADEIEAGEGM